MAVRLGTAPARKGTSAPHLLAGSEDHFLGLRDLRETAALLLSKSDSMRKIHQVISSVFFGRLRNVSQINKTKHEIQ